mmetsp:Transcript_78614/g.108838  ORF Transcript_78614/g.108838 Transcript_78614/m.108838 type:complete len:226 (-) Transcript_78614:262-939(-)|eukprot:CAMPEP_0176383852 /NCGR_PEP_ID=MMETSP0126-20121128/33842_1 /TAXON_ID=141414 ORGANISM="Strombidinopsis acuminatum, Strain SPMC142" /NCGR_SAMPLE_ID=MMETSP0126 /ASSEMBLY_ACC=CAM_ASM_000229 /LENGTH=225 /DNA_ID=CAMNT_0017749183 /DNA_START=20 /DNA_END=697 /DNA_ORIENTATION=+
MDKKQLDVTQEAILRKRRRDDVDKNKRIDIKAKALMQLGRKKKMAEKEAAGKNVLMPDVFVSNYMKQQRNYVHYKRHKGNQSRMAHVEDVQKAVLPKEQRVPKNKILMVVRIKESRNTSMQVQKILREFGLKEINNLSFLMASDEVIKQLLLIKDFVAYGTPTKKLLNDIIRKRGFLKAKDNSRVAITDNVLIEELLGDHGCICIEDVIEAFWKCDKHEKMYKEC